MKVSREILEGQLTECERNVRGLNSYITELRGKTAAHGTDPEHYEKDLMEAEHNIKYYEGEMARVRELLCEESGDATYWVYEDDAGEWRWQLRAGNNRIIADSGEGYQRRQDCLHGIELVKDSKDAPVKEKQ